MCHCIMNKIKIISLTLLGAILFTTTSFAFWIWTPESKTLINPKFSVKDSPEDQYEWAMKFYNAGDFKRAADEFVGLTQFYPDSDLAPEAQYYAGRSYEESAKYYFAYQNYQKTLDKYPYTKRMQDIIQREYNIAQIFEKKESPKLMELELSLSLDRAIEIYNNIVKNSPYGEYADQSLYNMAECYRRAKKYAQAIEAYDRLVKDYPDSKLAVEAKYQISYTKYESSLDPEYDQESTDKAIKDFKRISETSAAPKIAEEANKVFLELNDKKAESLLKIAEFYERQKQYRSAIMYYKDIIQKCPNSYVTEYVKAKIEILEGKVKE